MSLDFPHIDPVALALGPIEIRWYALAYISGILLGWLYIRRLLRLYPEGERPHKYDIEDFMTWVILSIILGGRLGYILFYNVEYYIENPMHILRVWEGGMSFHGGFLGVCLAIIFFSLKNKIEIFRLADLLACAAPIGLFLGRLSNFINAELYGRVTDVPWGVVFPFAGDLARHPSQLYEAGLEGVLLFVILFVCSRIKDIRKRSGLLAVIFIEGYALSRFVVEFFREPDEHLGYLFGGLTMGQYLSIGMMLAASLLTVLVLVAHKNKHDKA